VSRRVVVTGVGLLSSVGIGTEATWQGVIAGKSGIGPITAFDAQLFSCRIAGEIQGFEPGNYIEKKEIKKMGRFIQFAIAAADCATTSAALRVDPE
jgi:3-oxoacyl-[acyl-carrier-protein] synthase II